MKDLNVVLVQLPIETDCLNSNLSLFSDVIAQQPAGIDLIVLPEVFNAGFLAERHGRPYAETPMGSTHSWLAEQAKVSGAVITGSLIVESEPGCYVNRLIWMRPDGSFEAYDKCHLFRMGGEHQRYSAGDKKIIVELNGWRICPLICYDLRFPVFCRNRYENQRYDYDLLIYVANWPQARRNHWRTLLQARAIENQACVVGVNRIGVDAKGLSYSGDSLAFDARGEALSDMQFNEGAALSSLSATELHAYRRNFPAYLDADKFDLS